MTPEEARRLALETEKNFDVEPALAKSLEQIEFWARRGHTSTCIWCDTKKQRDKLLKALLGKDWAAGEHHDTGIIIRW